MIFQDPMTSLNPVLTIGRQIAEAVITHQKVTPLQAEAVELLETVAQPEAADRCRAYPHQFSGGQLQRIGIARALAPKPDLLALGEPVSALKVSVQAGNIRLLQHFRDELGLAYLFIAHDLPGVRHLSDRVAEMYLGKIAESASTAQLYSFPAHPYPTALLSAAPIPTR